MSNGTGSTQAARSRFRVCHISSVHRVNDVRVFHKECVTLAEAGFSVTLIGVQADVPDHGVNVITLPNTGNRFERMVGRARTAYRHALDVKADIYHFHDLELLPYGLMLKRRTGARVIFDSHECFREDIVGKDWIPRSLRKPIGHAVGAVEDFVVKRLDQVVAATPHIAESFAGQARRIVTVNNYPLEGEFTAAAEASASERDGVCYIGAISFARGIIPFLDAVSLIDREVKVHIAGVFAGAPVEAAVKAHPNWSRVTFHGQVSRTEVANIYAACFAGMVTMLPMPNHIYAQPNKLFEYMAAGIPVIGSHFPLWRSVIVEGGCGIAVDPAAPMEIAAAIEALRADRSLAQAMGARGVELVRDTYNWQREGRRLVETYDELLEG